MEFDLSIPLQEMEQLEFKYGIHLHVEQRADGSCDYFVVNFLGDWWYLGTTIEKVKEVLKQNYGY